MTDPSSAQLGFDALLDTADRDNRARTFARESAHLPSTMDQALPFYRALLDRHHAAMLAADAGETMRLRREAHNLARRVNGGDTAILAGPDAPGRVLERETDAAPGAIPLWGQSGAFTLALDRMRVLVEMQGIFGIAAAHCFWPGFAARAVCAGEPFLSPTGYRSFLGLAADPQPGLLPDAFARKAIAAYVEGQLKGRLVAIEPRYREDSG